MDISQKSDPNSQDEIPVRSSFGKNIECYVRERYLKKISVVGVYLAAIPSEKFGWECLPPIEVSNLLCYLLFTQISSLRLWEVWIRQARWFLVSLRQFKGKIVVTKVRNSQWMNDPLLDHCSVCREHPVGKYSNSVNSYLLVWNTRRPALTAMANCSEEKASSFPLFRFPSSSVEVIGWLKSIWATERLLFASLRRSLPLQFTLSLVRPRASSYRFFVLSSLSTFASWSNLAR